jgi:hypothetical protein
MIPDQMNNQLKNLSKKDLLNLIQILLDKNDHNYQLINHILNKKNQSIKPLKGKIRRSMERDGAYHSAYQMYIDYVRASVDDKSILELSKDVLEYFFIELEAYGHPIPEDLYDYTLDIYESALKSARALKDLESADDLYTMIGVGYEDTYEAFVDIFHMYFSYDDEENIIIDD